MKGLRKVISGGIILAGLVGLFGCDKNDSRGTITHPLNDFKPHHINYGYGTGVAAGDVDGDGLNDLVVGTPIAVKYFKNKGNMRFEEVQTVCHPLNDFKPHHINYGYGVGVALSDLDNNGKLDLIVSSPLEVRAYKNVSGRFEEVK